MKGLTLVVALFSVLALTGCGGGGGGDDALQSDATEAYSLLSFDVIGTDDDGTHGAPIDPNQNGGEFSIEFSLDDHSEHYSYNLYASRNDNLSTSTDTLVYSDACIDPLALCYTASSFEFDCTFNTSNVFDCSGGDDPVDLTDFFDTLPQNSYLILQTCAFPGLQCDTPQARPVEFR